MASWEWAGANASPVPGTAPLHLRYPGIAAPVLLQEAPEVLSGLLTAISGWVPEIAAATPTDRLTSAALRSGRGKASLFNLRSPFLDAPLTGLPGASTVCGVIADMAQAYFEERPGSIALHCGAVEIAGHLVALAGRAHAGKSTLMARLTAEADLQVYCDDILPILTDGQAVGLGIAPRLRLPLPPRSSAGFRAHVATHGTLRDDCYAYVTAPTVAPHGSRARLAAFVLLDRQPRGAAVLHDLPRSEAIRHMIEQNMADPGENGEALARFTDLAAGMCCLRLVYADLEEAVALLRRAFDQPALPGTADGMAVVAALPPVHDQTAAASLPPADLALTRHRAAAVGMRRLGPEICLWRPGQGGTFALNAVATAVWTLLDEPITGHEIAAILSNVFPDVDHELIASDVASLLAGLMAEGLVQQSAA